MEINFNNLNEVFEAQFAFAKETKEVQEFVGSTGIAVEDKDIKRWNNNKDENI